MHQQSSCASVYIINHRQKDTVDFSSYKDADAVRLFRLMHGAGRDPAAEFAKERIPGSKFFDVDKIADTSSSLPHMLPSPSSFAAALDCLGVKNDSTVVIYDRAGIFSAPRVWWTFKVFGHNKSVATPQ